MNNLHFVNCQPTQSSPLGGQQLSTNAPASALREYKSASGLDARLWVYVVPSAEGSVYRAVRDKLLDGGLPLKGFDLLQLRVSGVVLEVVAAYPGADRHAPQDALLEIPACHMFALAADGVQCAQVPCPTDVLAGAWLLFALPKAQA